MCERETETQTEKGTEDREGGFMDRGWPSFLFLTGNLRKVVLWKVGVSENRELNFLASSLLPLDFSLTLHVF